MKLTLKTVGKEYVGNGKTAEEALNKIDLTWERIKGTGEIILTSGKKQADKIYTLTKLRRIFANKTLRMLEGKRLELLLEDKKI